MGLSLSFMQPAFLAETLPDMRSHTYLSIGLPVCPSVLSLVLYSFTTFRTAAAVVTQDVFAREGDTVIYADNAARPQNHGDLQHLPVPLFGLTAAGNGKIYC